MPQTVKIQTGFSEKSTQNFQSTQHSISLEMDCAINGSTSEIEDASQKLFALCRKIVSVQKSVNVDSLLNNDATQTPSPPAPVSTPATGSNVIPIGTATSKQIKYLLELAKKASLTHDEILAIPGTYNKNMFEQLSASEASSLINRFKMKQAA